MCKSTLPAWMPLSLGILTAFIVFGLLMAYSNREKPSNLSQPPERIQFEDVYEPYVNLNRCVDSCQSLYSLEQEKESKDVMKPLLDMDYAVACKQACQAEFSRVKGNTVCVN